MAAILVVDDRRADLIAISAVLESFDCRIDVATTGEQALERAAATDYSVMIIDLNLPTIDGLTTATRLRALERTRTVPLILVSSQAPATRDGRVFVDGAAIDFLSKPLDIDELRAKVGALLEVERPERASSPAVATDRLARLQSVAEALSRALTPSAVSAVVLEHGVRAMGADTCLVYAASENQRLALLGHRGLPPEVARALATIDRDADMPGLVAMRSGNPVFTETMDEYRRAFPDLARRSPMGGPPGCWCVPLVVGAETVGAVAMGYLQPRVFPGDEREFITTFARQCAIALERARLYEQQQLANDRLRTMADELRAAVRVRDDFLSIASHELNTPLAALKLQIGRLLRHPPPPEKMTERIVSVDGQLDRLSSLVDELLDVSRIRAGRFVLVRDELDLSALVAEVVARFDEHAPLVQLSLAVDVFGRWDRNRLDQVVTNLVSNAIKYGAGEPIEIILAHDGVHAHLTVRDRGIGVAPEDHQRIFDRFERAAPGASYGGLGLGLWISARIVEAHGGAIEVESTVGQGSTFRVRLPGVIPIRLSGP